MDVKLNFNITAISSVYYHCQCIYFISSMSQKFKYIYVLKRHTSQLEGIINIEFINQESVYEMNCNKW